MANILSLHKISKEFGGRQLFKDLSWGIEEGEHIGLIGPNGAGKSTLLRIITGEQHPDRGEVSKKSGLKVSYLDQVPKFFENDTVFESVQREIKGFSEEWEAQAKAAEYLNLLDLDTAGHTWDSKVSSLSGGWKKKVAIVRALAQEPDLLLLDEPTNHLDVESIEWLEQLIKRAAFACIVITHDRAFLQNISTKMIEIDPRIKNGMLSVSGSYADYLEIKQGLLNSQLASEEKLKNTLRRETEWLRRGPQARTTKQQARIDRAGELSDTVADFAERNKERKVNLDFKATEGGPKKLIDAKGISKSFKDKCVFKDLDLVIAKGSRIALLGKNGIGKSTLIKTLTGEISPDTGSVQLADNLKIAYFEQNRESLNPDDTLRTSVCPQGDYVKLRDRHIHINSYLERFLFRSEQFNSPLRKLSGGEQSRILIAKLMLQEANLLVLDEPTNDLDVATLDLLQEQLEDFDGAILLVTHDRYFLDQVCNEILYLNNSTIERFWGLGQWEAKQKESKNPKKNSQAIQGKASPTPVVNTPSKKLSYNEQREFEGMEKIIGQKELRLKELLEKTNTQKLPLSEQRTTFDEISSLQSEVEKLYSRWAELEAKKS